MGTINSIKKRFISKWYSSKYPKSKKDRFEHFFALITLLTSLLIVYNSCDSQFEAIKPLAADFFENSSLDTSLKLNEGMPNTIQVPFNSPSKIPISLDWVIIDSSSSTAKNFQPSSGQISIRPGDAAISINTNILADVIYKGEEDYALVIQWIDPITAEKREKRNILKVADNKLPPQLKLKVAQANEGADLAFDVELSELAYKEVTFDFQTIDESAIKGKDYIATQGSMSITPGQTGAKIIIKSIDDNIYEGNQEFKLKFSNVTFATTSSDSINGIIISDDLPPTINIAQPTVTENMNAVIAYTLSHPSDSVISFSWATRNGTAVAPGDYEASSGVVTVPAGTVMGQITVKIMDDALDEASEEFFIDFKDVTNATMVASSAVRISESDLNMAPMVSVGPQTFTENIGTAPVAFTLNKPSGRNLAFNISTINKTANSSDYTIASPTVTIPAGQIMGVANLRFTNDTNYEGPEKLDVVVTSADNTMKVQAEITINDDDPKPQIRVENRKISEYLYPTAFVTVSLSGASFENISFSYSTSDGSAKAGSDYLTKSGTATIPAGQTSVDLEVTIVRDQYYEVDENFFVTISNVQNATVSNATGTITMDDGHAIPYPYYEGTAAYGDPNLLTPCLFFPGVPVRTCYYRVEFYYPNQANVGNLFFILGSDVPITYSWTATNPGSGGTATGQVTFPARATSVFVVFPMATTIDSGGPFNYFVSTSVLKVN